MNRNRTSPRNRTSARKRSVTYCRVSTQEQVQKDALEVQVKEAAKVSEEQGWILVDQYVEMESATTAEGRSEYQRLIADMHSDKFDIIIIKSLDRMNRNAKDWYLFLDELVSHDKQLYIYMEREFYRADNNLLTGIKVILAEQYSRDLSKKINNAHAYRQTNGTTVLITNNTYGFRKNRDKSVSVIPEEAEIIHRMYDMTAQGYGSRTISVALYEDGITNRKGNQITETTIRRIIRNPLFKGTAVMNKTHFDFEKKKTIKNPPSEWIYHPNKVPAIVDDELWEQANRMMDLNKKSLSSSGSKKKPEAYDFTGKICCGECGSPYYKTSRRRYSDKADIIVEWKCSNYLRNGRKEKNRRDQIRKIPKKNANGCDNIHLKNSGLIKMVDDLAHNMFKTTEKDSLINQIMNVLKRVLLNSGSKNQKENLQKNLKELSRKKELLLDKLLEGVVSDTDYQKKIAELTRKEESCSARLLQEEEKRQAYVQAEQRLKDIRKRLNEDGSSKILSELLLSAISKITVYEAELVIELNPSVLAQLPGKVQGNDTCEIRVKVQDYFSQNRQLQEQKKERLLELLGNNPTMTARQLAAELQISLSMARRWIDDFRKKNVIYFDGKGGKGKWVVNGHEGQEDGNDEIF